MVCNFFNNFFGDASKRNEQLANELHNPIYRKFTNYIHLLWITYRVLILPI